MEIISGLIMLTLLLAAYFVPSIVAVVRKHNNTLPIVLVNLLLGWMLIGWLVALIWSTTDNVKKV